MKNTSPAQFACKCQNSKKFKLTLDGGSTGQYVLELCKQCYEHEDKRFLISEEMLKKDDVS